MLAKPPFTTKHLFILTLIVWLSACCASAQTLSTIRQEVREPPGTHTAAPPLSSADERRKRTRDDDFGGHSFGDNDGGLNDLAGELIGAAAIATVSAPFVVPRAMLGDEGGRGYYPDYPYDQNSSSVVFDDTQPGAHSSLIVLQADYGSDLDNINFGRGRIFGDIDMRIGFDAEATFLNEDLATGNDDLALGDVNLTYRFAQDEYWQFRAGLGVNWLHDSAGTEAGFNSTYTVEWFPTDPVVLTGMIDWGRIGDSSLFHYRGTAGVTRNGWGLYTGYDFLKIGDAEIHAWINGLEYRF